MYVQIVQFGLKGMTDAEFGKLCEEVAPTVAAFPGLISKVFLADPATDTYGGVYVWQNAQDMEAYAKSDFFTAIANHPSFTGFRSQTYGALEAPSIITRGVGQAVR
jgi:heme-degrading monooxygenase HmoA